MDNKILIIDDSAVDRKIIETIVRKSISNIEVIESEDGLNIDEIFKDNKVLACVLDLKMPLVDGIEILGMMKRGQETSDIPVIVCTGVNDTEMMEKVLSMGAYDYFTKPFSDETMKYSLPLKIRNAIELSKRTKYILNMSQIDSLTCLYNRRYFKNFLDNYIFSLYDIPVTMFMCDINGLKVINDAFGSCAGDYFLKKISEVLLESLPESSICSRWGGDEFAVFVPNLANDDAISILYEIKSKSQNIMYEGMNISLAIGFETSDKNNDKLQRILKASEDAMYRDKILENKSTHSAMIATILHTLNVKNPREEAHSRRVSELCEKIGVAINLGEKEIRELKLIGLIHDIGKITIDEKILNKPEKLSDEEYAEIKRHPEMGYRILSTSKEMTPYLDIILCHHERIDGKGYPKGLKGDQIPLMSKILTIADSYDAMTCNRPYREAKSVDLAVEELIKNSGTQFDREIVEIFIKKVVGDL